MKFPKLPERQMKNLFHLDNPQGLDPECVKSPGKPARRKKPRNPGSKKATSKKRPKT